MTIFLCSGGNEGGGDREMLQWHQEASWGDGIQKQQVTAAALKLSLLLCFTLPEPSANTNIVRVQISAVKAIALLI